MKKNNKGLSECVSFTQHYNAMNKKKKSTLQCFEQKKKQKKNECFPKIDIFMTILFIATNEINIDSHSHFLLQMKKKSLSFWLT